MHPGTIPGEVLLHVTELNCCQRINPGDAFQFRDRNFLVDCMSPQRVGAMSYSRDPAKMDKPVAIVNKRLRSGGKRLAGFGRVGRLQRGHER